MKQFFISFFKIQYGRLKKKRRDFAKISGIENDMAQHGICFDFYYRPEQSQFRQNNSAAAVDAHLSGSSLRYEKMKEKNM